MGKPQILCAALVGLFLLLIETGPAPAKEEVPPTPEEMIADLRASCAEDRTWLACWASTRKLGRTAETQFLLAIAMDPDCRRARLRLGHKRGRSGEWGPGREKVWVDEPKAVARHREEFEKREKKLLEKELKSFAVLGRQLVEDGEREAGFPLVLRAHLLDRTSDIAAEGLGLVGFRDGYVTPETLERLEQAPEPESVNRSSLLGRMLGMKTELVQCGSVLVEALPGLKDMDSTARLSHFAQALTSSRFGLRLRHPAWMRLLITRSAQHFAAVVDASIPAGSPAGAQAKRIGCFRIYWPEPFEAAEIHARGSIMSATQRFVHMVAEDVLYLSMMAPNADWLTESVGVDTSLDILGRPGLPCVGYEVSQGDVHMGGFSASEDWGRRLLLLLGREKMPRLSGLVRASLTALDTGDVIAGIVYYRYLLRTRPGDLSRYLEYLAKELEPEEAFERAFEVSVDQVDREVRALLLGGR